jgi:hypothetical protein
LIHRHLSGGDPVDEDLWDAHRVASYLGMRCVETVRAWVKRGKLRVHTRVGNAMRFLPSEVRSVGTERAKPQSKRVDHTAADARAAFRRAMEEAKRSGA